MRRRWLIALGVFLMASVAGVAQTQGRDAQLEKVRHAVESQEWQQAQRLATAYVQGRKQSALGWTYLGLAESKLQHGKAALAAFAHAVRLAPGATYAHNNYGAALEEAGDAAGAAKEFERSLKLDGRQPAALVNLARLRSRQGTPEASGEARKMLEQAYGIAPDLEIARALLLLELKMEPEGPAQHSSADFGQVYRAYRNEIAKVGQAGLSPESGMEIARALLVHGHCAEAEQEIAPLLQASPTDKSLIAARARAEMCSGDMRGAGMTLESALRDGVAEAEIYALLADVYQKTGHIENAIPAMRRAVEQAPAEKAEEYLFRYALLLMDSKAPKAAEIRLRPALEQHRDSYLLWFGMGLAQFDQTQNAAAAESFDKTIALNAKFAPALAYRGLVALDQTKFDEAIGYYRRAIASDPSVADFHLLLAQALEKKSPDDLAAVEQEIGAALSRNPDSAAAHSMLGRVRLVQNRPQDATVELQRALELDPTLQEAHFQLARSYRRLGRAADAEREAKLSETATDARRQQEREELRDLTRRLQNVAF